MEGAMGQEDLTNFKNMMASDVNGQLNRPDRSGESRGSRRSVVFSKVKNNSQGGCGSNNMQNGGPMAQNTPVGNKMQTIKMMGNEKQMV